VVEALDILSPVLDRIADRAATHDIESKWPEADLIDLASIGAMRWAIGKAWGGEDLDGPTLHDHYELIASASLATALVLSQRDAAAEFIESSTNAPLRDRLLPQLVQNKVWSTIGISHLTTSHQSGTLTAERDGDGFLVNGTIPWATGACKSDFIVAAAKTLDEQQLLFVLPVDLPGVTVLPPLKLATLAAAPTSPVRCAAVRIGPDLVLNGPSEAVLVGRSRNVAISQAFAAFGIIRASLQLIKQIDIASAANSHDLLSQQFHELRSTVHDANARLAGGRDLQSGPLIRSECSNLASRAAQSAVTLYKGSALKLDHPAQRLAREALFLLVWSSPMSVVDRTLELIADPH
jgi:alkylation response protein AidB-like acyl-CoA dehydrogenase